MNMDKKMDPSQMLLSIISSTPPSHTSPQQDRLDRDRTSNPYMVSLLQAITTPTASEQRNSLAEDSQVKEDADGVSPSKSFAPQQQRTFSYVNPFDMLPSPPQQEIPADPPSLEFPTIPYSPNSTAGKPNGGRDVINVDDIQQECRDISITPITLMATEVIFGYGRKVVAVSDQFIFYPVKGGRIRCIQQDSGQNFLLKGHTNRVLDICFNNASLNEQLLASICSEMLIVWKLNYGEVEQSFEKLLEIYTPQNFEKPRFQRVIWHPNSPHKFCVANSSKEIMLFNIEGIYPTRTTEEGAKSLYKRWTNLHTGEINDIAYSNDGTVLATAGEDGMVHCIREKDGVKLWSMSPAYGAAISSIHFCNGFGLNESLDSVLLIGTERNTQLFFYDLATMKNTLLVNMNKEDIQRGEEQFNVLIYIPDLRVIAIADNLRRCFLFLRVCHDGIELSGKTESLIEKSRGIAIGKNPETTIQWAIDCPITHPVIGFQPLLSSCFNESTMSNSTNLSLYAVQNKSVQEYRVEGSLSVSTSGQAILNHSTTTENTQSHSPKKILESNLIDLVPKKAFPNQNIPSTDGKIMATTKEPHFSDSHFSLNEDRVVSKIALLLNSQTQELRQQQEELRVKLQNFEAHQRAATFQILTKELNNNVKDHLDASIRHETERSIVPTLVKITEVALDKKLEKVIQQVMEKNLAKNIENSLGKALELHLSQSNMASGLINALANQLTPIINKIFLEKFTSNLIPAYEKATHAMFKQIENAFLQGVAQIVESNKTKELDGADPKLIEQLSLIQSSLGKLQETIRGPMLDEYAQRISTQMNEKLIHSLSNEIGRRFSENEIRLTSPISSQIPASPLSPSANIFDLKQDIMTLLDKKEYDAAFTKVLSKSDLALVTWLCEQVNPKELDENDCPLSQPVLLSLIHQLSLELETQSDIKLTWMQESLMLFHPEDASVSHHAPRVIPLAKRRIAKYYEDLMNTSPGSSLLKKTRLIQYVLNSLMAT